ncbi:MAG: hypothetical protein EOP89_10270, partial [Lysobacteraceae bacterium]
RDALMAFVRGGGGIVGVHGAADSHYHWDWYGRMIGARFARHPEGTPKGQVTRAPLDHPSIRDFPASAELIDEWYWFDDLDPRLRPLLTLDPGSIGEKGVNPRPLAWAHVFEGGRVFYTGLGHTKASWSDFCSHYGQWKYGKVLLGTAGSWFFLDVAFYGVGLNNATILQAIGYAKGDSVYKIFYNISVGNLILVCAGAIPGYWVTVATVDTVGRKPIQMGGFIILTIMFCIMGFGKSLDISRSYRHHTNQVPGYHKIGENGLILRNDGHPVDQPRETLLRGRRETKVAIGFDIKEHHPIGYAAEADAGFECIRHGRKGARPDRPRARRSVVAESSDQLTLEYIGEFPLRALGHGAGRAEIDQVGAGFVIAFHFTSPCPLHISSTRQARSAETLYELYTDSILRLFEARARSFGSVDRAHDLGGEPTAPPMIGGAEAADSVAFAAGRGAFDRGKLLVGLFEHERLDGAHRVQSSVESTDRQHMLAIRRLAGDLLK